MYKKNYVKDPLTTDMLQKQHLGKVALLLNTLYIDVVNPRSLLNFISIFIFKK